MKRLNVVAAACLLLPVAAMAQEPVAAPKTVNCINLRDIDSTDVKDSKTIIFKMRGKKYYKNELSHSCSGLNAQKAFLLRTSTPELCSVDIIYVLENYGGVLRQGAACGLGKFVEYTPPPKLPKTEKPKN